MQISLILSSRFPVMGMVRQFRPKLVQHINSYLFICPFVNGNAFFAWRKSMESESTENNVYVRNDSKRKILGIRLRTSNKLRIMHDSLPPIVVCVRKLLTCDIFSVHMAGLDFAKRFFILIRYVPIKAAANDKFVIATNWRNWQTDRADCSCMIK